MDKQLVITWTISIRWALLATCEIVDVGIFKGVFLFGTRHARFVEVRREEYFACYARTEIHC